MTERCCLSRFTGALLVFLALAAPRAAAAIDTFAAYELRLQRVETFWGDVRAVTERRADGQFIATLYRQDGTKIAERWTSGDREAVSEAARSDHAEAAATPSRLNALLEREYRKTEGAAAPRLAERVTMHFGGFVAESRRDPFVPIRQREKGTAYSTFHTVLLHPETGAQIGIIRWFDREEVLVWRFPEFGDLGRGDINPERIAKAGGWKRRPDMTWAGVQALAFYEGYTRVREMQAARPIAADATAPVSSQTCDGQPDGCTGLHWLDNSVVRPCCDEHDRCFEFHPPDGCCSAWSWLLPTSWRCLLCNIDVILCFLTNTSSPGGGGGTGGGGGGECTVSGAEWCPPECFSCYRGF